MRHSMRCRMGAIVAIFGLLGFQDTSTLAAGERSAPTGASGPVVTFFAASLNKFQSACERVFQSVDRQDLFDSMDSRLTRYNNFSGVDRNRPLGMMFTWGNDVTPYAVFLPVINIDELLKTATFGVVGSHKVSTDHYEIERPHKPYQVVLRRGTAFIAESVETIQSVCAAPELLTRRLRDQYDLAIHIDLRQIPLADKREFVKHLRANVIPALQTADDEAAESGWIRKAVGVQLLEWIERATIDINALTIGLRFTLENRHLILEVELEAVPKSPLARSFDQCLAKKNHFSPCLHSEVQPAAVAVISLPPVCRLVPPNAGESDKRPSISPRLDAVMQLIGERPGERSVVAAVSGLDAKAVNPALTQLLSSGFLGTPSAADQIATRKGTCLRSFMPTDVLPMLATLIGTSSEVLVSEVTETFWVGFGSPMNLLDDLEDAMEFVDEAPPERTVMPIVQVQIQGRAVPDLLVSDLLIPNMNAAKIREELSRGDDGIAMKVNAINNGLKLTVDFDPGFVRLIGRDWVRQVEGLYRPDRK